MEVTALCLLIMIKIVDSDEAAASVTVSPARQQFFKYDNFSVSCEDEEREDAAGWKVMMKMKDEEVRSGQPPYTINAAFPMSDSGAYWCETGPGATSNRVNITVTDGLVILESPVHPVTEGVDLTLSCTHKAQALDDNLQTLFYKDGLLIKNSSTGHMTIGNVSRSDQGLYKCEVVRLGSSPESWLIVRAPPAGQEPPPPQLYISPLVRHIVVGAPYLLCTILLGLIHKDKKREKDQQRQTDNGTIIQIK